MELQGSKLVIDARYDNEKLSSLAKEILLHLDDIQEVEVDDSHGVESSAIFSLLASIKKSASHIKIDYLDSDFVEIKGVGTTSVNVRG